MAYKMILQFCFVFRCFAPVKKYGSYTLFTNIRQDSMTFCIVGMRGEPQAMSDFCPQCTCSIYSGDPL